MTAEGRAPEIPVRLYERQQRVETSHAPTGPLMTALGAKRKNLPLTNGSPANLCAIVDCDIGVARSCGYRRGKGSMWL